MKTKSICKRCHEEMTEFNRGQWAATGCCITCEHRALVDAIAANDARAVSVHLTSVVIEAITMLDDAGRVAS